MCIWDIVCHWISFMCVWFYRECRLTGDLCSSLRQFLKVKEGSSNQRFLHHWMLPKDWRCKVWIVVYPWGWGGGMNVLFFFSVRIYSCQADLSCSQHLLLCLPTGPDYPQSYILCQYCNKCGLLWTIYIQYSKDLVLGKKKTVIMLIFQSHTFYGGWYLAQSDFYLCANVWWK